MADRTQAGPRPTDAADGYPVSVEITYGLDRIAITLQNVNSFREIQWSPALTEGDVNLQAEQEHSKYYFEIADVERLRAMYDLYEAEAAACLDQNLVLPAHGSPVRGPEIAGLCDANHTAVTRGLDMPLAATRVPSDTETVVRSHEKLRGNDAIEPIAPPWGNGAHFAMMPLAEK